jgi:hypothetical protein
MRWYGVLAVVAVLAGGASPATAQHARDHVRAGRVQPLDRILPHVRNSRPGTFYDAEGPFRGPDGRMHYRLKWMTPGGRIIWLDTDAHTGRVLGVDRGARRPAWEHEGGRYRGRRYAPDDRDYRRRDYRRGDGWRGRGHERGRRHDGYRDRRGRGGYDRGRERGGFRRGGGHGHGHGHGRGRRHGGGHRGGGHW